MCSDQEIFSLIIIRPRGIAELKQLWKNEFRASAFFLSSVMFSLMQESVRIMVALDPLRALIAVQTC